MLDAYEKIQDIGKGKNILNHKAVCQHTCSGSFGYVSKIKRISDGRLLVWKELDYGKMNEKEK